MSAKILFENGKSQEVTPKNGTDFKLDELQKIVGGHIEIVYCNNPEYILVINEEGKFVDHFKNIEATKLVSENLFPDDYIAGDALYCKSVMVK